MIAIYERLATTYDLNEGVLELGINACILGIGVSGALFSTPEVGKNIGVSGIALTVIILFADLAITGLCLHLRRRSEYGWVSFGRAALGIFLGLLSLGINTGIVLFFGVPA
ncbi:MAG: hypothetical protein ACXW3C_02680 [Pyrinomonadaceae bacterium]